MQLGSKDKGKKGKRAPAESRSSPKRASAPFAPNIEFARVHEGGASYLSLSEWKRLVSNKRISLETRLSTLMVITCA